MSDETQPKKASRAPRVPEAGRRPTITFRCRADLKAELEASAQERDHSLSEEIERRLYQSFRDPEMVNKITTTAMTSIITKTMEDVISGFGGVDGYDAGRLFGQAFTDRLELVTNYFPDAQEPWYRDRRQQQFIHDKLLENIIPIILHLAERKIKSNPNNNELFAHMLDTAQNLGIQTTGLDQRQVIEKINEYYENRSSNSEDWPDDVKPMR